MGLPTGEIQTAVIAKLRGDATLQGLLTGAVTPYWSIFDEGGVPTNQAFPYVATFPIMTQSGTALTMATDATDVFLQISVYTQAGGFKSARAIAKQVYTLINRQSLTLAGGFTNFFTLFENEQELAMEGVTQGVVHRYKLMTQG